MIGGLMLEGFTIGGATDVISILIGGGDWIIVPLTVVCLDFDG